MPVMFQTSTGSMSLAEIAMKKLKKALEQFHEIDG